MGQAPADLVGAALATIARDRQRRGGECPPLRELLGCLLGVLSGAVADLCVDGEGLGVLGLWALRLRRGPLWVTAAPGLHEIPADEQQRTERRLRKALSALSAEYVRVFGRKPQLTELLGCVVCALRGAPEELLRDGDVVEELHAELHRGRRSPDSRLDSLGGPHRLDAEASRANPCASSHPHRSSPSS